MENKKSRRGGARPGAGHPKGDSRMISFRAPRPLAEQLEGMENRTEFIRKALSMAVKESRKNPGLHGIAIIMLDLNTSPFMLQIKIVAMLISLKRLFIYSSLLSIFIFFGSLISTT